MSQVIELLEKAKQFTGTTGCSRKIDQALAILKQPKDQPSSEFTKKVRLNLENWGTVLGIQEDVRVRTIVDWLKEACKIIGKSEASRKELLEALENYIDDETCSFDHHGCCQTHYGDPCRNQQAKAAIAKDKAVGE